jgi:hypothetical protein
MKNETEFLTYLETASVEEITSDLKAVNNIKLPKKDAKSFNNFYPLISDYRRGGGSTTSPIKYIVELKNLLNIALSMNSKIIVPKLLQFPFEITPMGIYLIFNNNYKSYYPEIISRKLSTSLNIVETFYYDMYFQSLELDYPTLPTIPESYSFISLDKSIEYRTYKNMNIGEIILELANIHYLSENFKPHLDIDSYLTKLNILYDKGFAYAFNYNHRLMEADVTFVRRFLKILFVRQPNSVGIVKLTDDVQKLYDSFDLFSLFKEERRRTLQNNKKNYLPNNLVEALRNETTTAFKIGVNIIRFFYILYQKIGPSSVPVELVTIFKTFTKHDANIMVDVKNGITNYLLSCYQKTYNGWLTCYFLMRYADNENLITSDVHDNTDLTYLLTSL